MLEALRTPAEDGDVLLLPPPEQLPDVLDAARERFNSMDFAVAGIAAAELRQQARAEAAELIGADPPAPWIATGHQSEMHHAGVWFKDAATAAWAEATGGTAMHVVADLDTIHHVALFVPQVGDEGTLDVVGVRFARLTGRQCPAQLPAPPPETVEEISRLCVDCGMMDVWLAEARAAAGGTLAQWITSARAAVNTSLGLALYDVYWSRIVRGGSFARFAASICLDAERMFACHNEALAAHRATGEITNPTQPVPDLHRRDGAVEVPLWAFRPGRQREGLFVRPVDGGAELLTPAGPLASLPADADDAVKVMTGLAAADVLIAPRALPLTMYLRAFVVDVFIHGTGGARYDVLGDELARRWLGWAPPPFATATATLRVDLPRYSVTVADRAAARWAVHHAWHNPFACGAAGGEDVPAEAHALRQRKIAALAQVSAAARLSAERAAAFAEVHAVNAELRECLASGQKAVADRLAQIESHLAHNAAADSREFFFALMPRAKLAALVQKARVWASA